MSDFRPGAAVAPSSQVELSVSCRNLLDRDILSKSDPVCIIYLKDPFAVDFREVGRTEAVKNSLNPDFVKKTILSYFFEESQKLRFDIYDWDVNSPNLYHQEYLGRMECTLGEIVACQGGRFQRALKGPYNVNGGNIIVSVEELGSCKEIVTLQFCATNLDKKDFLGKSDPFIVFHKQNDDGSFSVTHKTEVIKYTLNPTWRPFTIPARVLCSGNHERTIKFEVFDWDNDGGSHDLIGEFTTNLATLVQGPNEKNIYPCINHKKKAKKSHYKNSGIVRLMSCVVEQEYSFLDFIQGGTQLNFTVAIDFTASNGDPRNQASLHYIHPTMPNQYAVAIRAVGDIVQDYDSDKMFPALGFGAKIPPQGLVSHEFFLNGNPQNPYCAGVDGVLQAYYNSIKVVQLYGPTNFSPIINHVANFASAIRDGSNYFVLLMITDGIISDMMHTKNAIVQASGLPMSIIIVGVGNEDFSAMEELDGDGIRISNSTGQYAFRDIVQFVPLRNFLQGGNWQQNQARLAKEVLAEIPNQVTSYMRMNKIKPRAPIPLQPSASAPYPN